MNEYLLAALVIFGVNLLPAFGPPTWSILVFFTLDFDLQPAALVAIGALAAASGRFLLATGARRLRGRMSAERLASLEAAKGALTGGRTRGWAALGLFALSPLPSAQLFVAAGVLDLALVPITLAFFAGRIVSYSLYVGAATAASASLGEIVGDAFTSPVGIALQLLMLAALVALVRVDWTKVLVRAGSGADRPA